MSEAEAMAEIQRLDKIIESHPVDCRCPDCRRFMAVFDEVIRSGIARQESGEVKAAAA
jgi:hypothetical protein